MMTMDFKECTWSYLTDTPTFVHYKKYDAHICYWNGISLPRSLAIAIIGNFMYGIYPNKSQTTIIGSDIQRYYDNGWLDKSRYGHGIRSVIESIKIEGFSSTVIYVFMDKISSSLNEKNTFFPILKEKTSVERCLGWLSPEKILVVDE